MSSETVMITKENLRLILRWYEEATQTGDNPDEIAEWLWGRLTDEILFPQGVRG